MSDRRPLPLSTAPVQTLNRSEWAYVACDGPLGSLTQAYIYRFQQPIDAALARQAMRRMLSAFPRLRAVLEPTARRYQMRILPDDAALEHLFNLAFREEQVDLDNPAVLTRWHELALNDPLPIQRGLGWRVQFAAHPSRPALLLSMHHLLIDGRSLVQLTEALMQLLNGQPIEDVPLDSPSMLPAVLPPSWWQWPAKLWAARQQQKAQAQERNRYEIVRLPNQRSQGHVGCGVQHHDTGCAAKDLSRTGKAMGGSSNSLLIAALGTAMLDHAGAREGTAALIRLSVDLRRYYPPGTAPQMGNYVSVFDVLLPQAVPQAERVRWVDTRVREGLARFERREMILPLLPFELLGLIRSHDYTRLYRRSRRLDMMPKLSAHTTNIGSVDAFNAPDASVRLAELYPTVGGVAPLLVFVVVDGRQVVVTSHQRDEYQDQHMSEVMLGMRQVMGRWMQALA